MSASAEWKPKLRWLISRIFELSPSRRPLGEAEADGGEDGVAVAAQRGGEPDERLKAGAAGPGQPGVEVRGRERSVLEVVEQPQLLAQQERAVESAVGVADLVQGRELADGLTFGGLEQRPAGALDPAPGGGVGALVGVSFVAANLVGRAAGEPADVERVKADLGVGDRGANRALVLAAHVDQDRTDRVAAVAELVEEGLQGGAVASGAAPHDRARAVVGNAGEVALPAAVGDLVDADRDQAPQTALVEVLGGTRSTMRPTLSHATRISPVIGVLAICWASHATTSSKSRV